MLLRFTLSLALAVHLLHCINAATSLIEIEKPKDLKKTIATKTNLLVLFASSLNNREVVEVKNLLKSADGSFAIVDCADKTLKKQVCKKSLPEGSSYVLRHYKDGSFNKVYDRQLTKASLQYFLKDPTGEIPFVEEPTSADVVHVVDVQVSKHCINLVTLHSFNLFSLLVFFLFINNKHLHTAIRQVIEAREAVFDVILYKLVWLLQAN